jgi:hypothetical protein
MVEKQRIPSKKKISLNFRVQEFNNLIYLSGIAPVFFGISFFLLKSSTGGDQVHYHKFYESLKYAKLDEIMTLAYSHVSSAEPLSAFVLWIGAQSGLEKNIYISILNVILIVGIFLLARKHQANPLTIFLLLTNFYLVVLMTGAERLKIAHIVLVYAGLFEGRARFMLSAASPFAHLQILIFLVGAFASKLESSFRNLLNRFVIPKKELRLLLISIISLFVFAAFLFEGVMRKITAYASLAFSPFELLNIGILSIIALYITRRRLRMFLVLLPMFPAVIILGPTRVNMIAVTLVIYFLMIEHRLHHPLMLMLMLYFSFKSIPFIKNIILYSNGFA